MALKTLVQASRGRKEVDLEKVMASFHQKFTTILNRTGLHDKLSYKRDGERILIVENGESVWTFSDTKADLTIPQADQMCEGVLNLLSCIASQGGRVTYPEPEKSEQDGEQVSAAG